MPFDAVIHLGDGEGDAEILSQILAVEVISVAGNCDHGSSAPRELIMECEGKLLLLTHGDLYGIKKGMGRLEQRGIESEADVVLFGHTHYPAITDLAGKLFINPGTLMNSACRSTYAILDIIPAGITASLHDIERETAPGPGL
jgi:putative phosphoesterase